MSEVLDTLKNTAIEAEGAVENLKAELVALENAQEVDKDAVKAKKAEIRKAESALNKANKAVTKEEIAAQKLAEKQAKAEAKLAEKQAKVDEKSSKQKAREEEKAAKLAAREANRMPEQNGIRRPKPEGKCGQVWTLADKLSAKLKQPVPISELLKAAEVQGLNPGNVKTEYARWRKFNGVTGRVSLPAAPEAKTEAKTEA